MTGTPGAATAGDGEAPERSPPFSPNYDLTGKVGGLCAQCWGPPGRHLGTSLPMSFALGPCPSLSTRLSGTVSWVSSLGHNPWVHLSL